MNLEELVTVRIIPDSDAESPRRWQENIGVMFCKHRRYTLGDEDADDPYEEVDVCTLDGGKQLFVDEAEYARDMLVEIQHSTTDAEDAELIEAAIVDLDGALADVDSAHVLRSDIAIILPLYLYDHSGITMSHGSFSCQWDSGQVGWHYMTKQSLQEHFNGDEERGLKCLEAELEEYDNYLRGNVWGYDIDGPGISESCWGFIGDDLDDMGLLAHVPDKFLNAVKAAWDADMGRQGVRTVYCTVDGEIVDPDDVDEIPVRRTV